jgi:hypothetical protein
MRVYPDSGGVYSKGPRRNQREAIKTEEGRVSVLFWRIEQSQFRIESEIAVSVTAGRQGPQMLMLRMPIQGGILEGFG